MSKFGLTVFTNHDKKPLSKTIRLGEGDNIEKIAAAQMTIGMASRWQGTMPEFVDLLDNMPSYQAIARGSIRDDLPDKVNVVTKAKLNGQKDTIARQVADIILKKNTCGFSP
jgi:hypothetical protein